VHLISGRMVTRSDLGQDPIPVVITQALSKKFFPDRDVLGKCFGPAGPDGLALPKYKIVGVLSDLKYRGMREVPPPTFYSAFTGQEELATLYVRTRLSKRAVRGLSTVRRISSTDCCQRPIWIDCLHLGPPNSRDRHQNGSRSHSREHRNPAYRPCDRRYCTGYLDRVSWLFCSETRFHSAGVLR
jgi:hypothetical protein